MEIFKSKTDLHKKYLSSDILLRTTGSHQSYRMALRNTKGPCIPSMSVVLFETLQAHILTSTSREVHTSDLRRANEGNPDVNIEDTSKINWAKYSMIGRFVDTTTQLQQRCRGPGGYSLVENTMLSYLFDITPMSYEVRIIPLIHLCLLKRLPILFRCNKSEPRSQSKMTFLLPLTRQTLVSLAMRKRGA